MNVLFVCARNRLRSPTAERVFDGIAGVQAASAGLAPDADEPLTAEWVLWADVILVMEPRHRVKMARTFGPQLRGRRVACLGIPDDYGYMDPELIRLLWDRVPRLVPALAVGRPR
ncbi:MAG: low molecular weight protein tyrosine phosphatase family protein [Phycisphaerae bacterium]